jgi:uncharacterized repeat protein (TIGR03803 family)
VFEFSADGKFRIVHTFKYSDGAIPPFGNLIRDASGNLYGTTLDGGDNGKCESGCGVVFKLGPRGKFTTLYNFTNGSDGADPTWGVTMDAAGNLYGVAQNFGDVEVFELTPSGEFHVLHSFNGTDGTSPNGLILDAKGNLYGTTGGGGDSGSGVVYKLDKAGTETVLYSFKGRSDGAYPHSTLFMDKAGALFGTTLGGVTRKGIATTPISHQGVERFSRLIARESFPCSLPSMVQTVRNRTMAR